MNFMICEGFLGAGKTLGAVIFAMNYVQKSGCAIYSNFGLVGSKPFTHLDDFKKVALEESSILVLDESHMDFDARSFSSNHVKFMSQTSYYLRKLRCTVIMTSPNFADIDSRIRSITNILLRVSKDKNNFYYDVIDIQSERYLKTIKIKRENAYMIGDLYFDTNKMVVPLEMPENRLSYDAFLEELKIVAESYHIERKGAALPRAEVVEVKQLVIA